MCGSQQLHTQSGCVTMISNLKIWIAMNPFIFTDLVVNCPKHVYIEIIGTLQAQEHGNSKHFLLKFAFIVFS